MITEKLLEYVKRQTLLSAKIADNTATPDERTEFSRINAAIKAATEPQTVEAKTLVTTMRLDEFQKHVESEMGALEKTPDADRLALLQRNIASVKSQGKTLAEDIVGVEIMTRKTSDDRIAALEATVADLSAKLAEAATTAEKAEAPTAHAMAMEAMVAMMSRMEALKSKVDSGSLTVEDLQMAWEGTWDIRDALRQAAAIMAKAEELHKSLSVVVPAWEVLAKGTDETDATDGKDDSASDTDEEVATVEGDDNADAAGDEGGEADDKGDGEDDKGDASDGSSGDEDASGDADSDEDKDLAEKDAGWGSDLAPVSKKGNEDYTLLKGRKVKDAEPQ